jgi:uncharacterized protein YqeY
MLTHIDSITIIIVNIGDNMLINNIKIKMMQARQGIDTVAKSLWVTLYAEASKVGKDKRNDLPTDEECTAVIRKFINNAQQTQQLLQSRSLDCQVQQKEIDLLTQLLPTQLTSSQLQEIIDDFITKQNCQGDLTSIQSLGKIMAYLKSHYDGKYDSREASQLVKQKLT